MTQLLATPSSSIYIRQSRVCRGHPDGKTVGVFQGVKIIRCPICGGARLKRTTGGPWVSSILGIAEVCYSCVPKFPEILIDGEKFVIHRAYGMGFHPKTTKRALEWIYGAAEKYGVSPNGILTQVHEQMDGKTIVKALTRLRDEFGDPPLLWTEFECPTCGKVWETSDLAEYECFPCTDCITWYIDRGEDGIEKIDYPIGRNDYGNVNGVVYACGTDEPPMGDVTVYLNKKQIATDAEGRFSFSFVPYGKYELKIDCLGYMSYTDTVEVSPLKNLNLRIPLERFDLMKHVVIPIGTKIAQIAVITFPILGLYLFARGGRK